MNRNIRSLRVLLLAGILLMAGCSPAASEVPPSSTPAPPTQSPTTIPIVEATSTPTQTLPPSATPTSLPTGVPSIGQHNYSTVVEIQNPDGESQTIEIQYLLYLPEGYGNDAPEDWPLILYLHGSGEVGNNLAMLMNQPLPRTLDRQSDFPFVVISPQLPPEMALNGWSDMIEPLRTLLENIQQRYQIDEQRLYLTGISLGGFGTWEFALRYPEQFAAIVPIAGGYEYETEAIPANICELAELPIWVFHGGRDTSVLPLQSEVLVEALEGCAGDVRYTYYPDAFHNDSWRLAYDEPELFQWLLEQRKGD